MYVLAYLVRLLLLNINTYVLEWGRGREQLALIRIEFRELWHYNRKSKGNANCKIALCMVFKHCVNKHDYEVQNRQKNIHFADIELSQPYLIVCNFYILIGLAFTSTIIELVRRQYNESWCKIQELRAQIQMQIKLAATMRQLAANNVDLEGMGMDLVRVHLPSCIIFS